MERKHLNISKSENAPLLQEADAFDRQNNERIANGHIPDLRLAVACDWFYNNAWRRPAYVQLVFGEQHSIIKDALKEHCISLNPTILEVGCGPGFLSLELARDGFEVTGIDLSERAVNIAETHAAQDPYIKDRGRLKYLCGDFNSDPRLLSGQFDAIVFLGALHHFPDSQSTIARAKYLLKQQGVLIAHEPARDCVTQGNAVFVHLLQTLLSVSNGFYQKFPIATNIGTLVQEFDGLFSRLRYESVEGEKLQSINDNEAGYSQIRFALDQYFQVIEFDWRYAFFHEFIGGLRFDEDTNIQLAYYLRELDRKLCELNVLSPTEFFYVGRAR